MLSDIEIAQSAMLEPITDIAAKCGLEEDELELYGKYKAKISEKAFERTAKNKDGKLILVTAVNPTPAGEGKTTVTTGLGQAMNKIGKNAIIALREPSLGPVFGIKGGAAGGGYSQVLPMEDINLHFTGDMHAIGAANNLLCALLDAHLQFGNELNIDTRRILIKRAVDMNDRALRNVVVGLGGPLNGVPREDGFNITVASEVMAVLCLASDLSDLKKRLGDIIVAYNTSGEPVRASDLKANGAMTALLKDAIKPNLVQTLEGTPALMHGGPFANIAHGCNSVRATKLALKLADYCITEAGFGADLGAEKFLDIKCRKAGLTPSAVVLVVTTRALKYNGGVSVKDELKLPNMKALECGIVNLEAHIENLIKYGITPVVAINRFDTDTDEEIAYIRQFCHDKGVRCEAAEIFAKGGDGGRELAQAVVEACEEPNSFAPIYELDMPIADKVEKVAKEIYGADGVDFTPSAKREIAEIEAIGGGKLPICIAKTQYSLSDNPKLLGRPTGFNITVKKATYSAGAGFVVVYTGDIMTMPGLGKTPAAFNIDVDENGKITGLF